jgi:TonB family protein
MRMLVVLLTVCSLAAPARGQDALSAAQAFYAAAQYEEALKAFDAAKNAGGREPRAALAIEQGRAFCLLALDRRADAEKAIETILGLDPFFKPAEDDTPPKIRTAFREVRRRALAGVLQQVYAGAKAAYERKAYDEAAAGFGQVLSLLEDPDLVLDAGPRSDMKLVAKAFEDLAKAASTPPANPAASPAPAGGAGDRPPAAGAPAVPGVSPSAPGGSTPAQAAQQKTAAAGPLYDAASKDVTAPVPQRTDVPIPESIRRSLPGGDVVVEAVVSTSGTVESAVVRQSPDSVLGALVARAVLDWRYRPAMKAGAPVRYRIMVKIVVAK